MRLINTTTLKLHEFIDARNAPPYAFLSHRWSDDEVSFKEYRKFRFKKSVGHRKITGACHVARSRSQEWLCVDTVCIDKRSSAELTEAINSMFDWYEKAVECYAYLADVEVSQSREETLAAIQRSEWFTHGWTLQELIAPAYVVFFARDWTIIGTKSFTADGEAPGVESILAAVASASGVPEGVLEKAS